MLRLKGGGIIVRLLGACALALTLIGSYPSPAGAQSRLSEFLQTLEPGNIFPGADRFGPVEGKPPAAQALAADRLLGYVYLNADVVNSIGYSGKPIIIVIALALDGKIAGAKLVEHHEPIVLIGIPKEKVENFIHGYVGLNFLDDPDQIRRVGKISIMKLEP